MLTKLKDFVRLLDSIWDTIPATVKVFMYSTLSSLIGLYLSDKVIDVKTVVYIVAVNLGLYKVPRISGETIKKLK